MRIAHCDLKLDLDQFWFHIGKSKGNGGKEKRRADTREGRRGISICLFYHRSPVCWNCTYSQWENKKLPNTLFHRFTCVTSHQILGGNKWWAWMEKGSLQSPLPSLQPNYTKAFLSSCFVIILSSPPSASNKHSVRVPVYSMMNKMPVSRELSTKVQEVDWFNG